MMDISTLPELNHMANDIRQLKTLGLVALEILQPSNDESLRLYTRGLSYSILPARWGIALPRAILIIK
jgi:hypothetical protein